MVYASVLQHYVDNSPPKSIHVWIQAPDYILVAFSEAFIIVTGLELAFTPGPKEVSLPVSPGLRGLDKTTLLTTSFNFSLRSVVSALFWLTIGIAAAICIALAPVS
ncbi:POT family protein [Colletotrichum abscissum]|nr:POT family protein [Colletotrichum abscissum]KAI3558914.1 POT family protein [Colletotrichum abscissum]KAK1513902.1 POT family protein [Colletotrichum abscissum]